MFLYDVKDPRALKKGDEMLVRIAAVHPLGVSSSYMSLQIVDPDFIFILNYLKKEMNNNKAAYMDFSNIRLGELRAHYNSKNHMWSRVRILNLIENKHVQVNFIDYGIDNQVKKHDCLLLPEMFKGIAPQYFFATLNNTQGVPTYALMQKYINIVMHCKIDSYDVATSSAKVDLFMRDFKTTKIDSTSINENISKGNGIDLPPFNSIFVKPDDNVSTLSSCNNDEKSTREKLEEILHPKPEPDELSSDSQLEELDQNHRPKQQPPVPKYDQVCPDIANQQSGSFNALITHINDLDEIYVQSMDTYSINLFSQLDEILPSVKAEPSSKRFKVGDLCIFSDDNKLYRGLVSEILDKDAQNCPYHIKQLDFGKMTIKFQKDLIECPPELLEFPKLCVKLSLNRKPDELKRISQKDIKAKLPVDTCVEVEISEPNSLDLSNKKPFPAKISINGKSITEILKQ